MKKLLLFLLMPVMSFALISNDQLYLLNNKAGYVPNIVQLGSLIRNAESLTGPSLTNGQILIGNGSNVAAAVTPSGEIALSNAGAFSMASMATSDGLYADRIAKATYDFSVYGGAQGTITLSNGPTIPAKSVVERCWLDIQTQPTSGGAATVAVQLEGAADILAATAIASLTVGRFNGVPVDTAATMPKTSVARQFAVAVATADLTAGKFTIVCRYFTSNF